MNKLVFALAVCLIFVVQVQSVSIIRDLMPMVEIQPALPVKYHGHANGLPIYGNCSGTSSKFRTQNVIVEGCSARPCTLKRGTNTSVEIDFIIDEVATSLTAEVDGQIAGAKVPFPLGNSDACTCGVQCPTTSGSEYKYKYELPVLSWYPEMELVVYWYLKDQDNNALCIDVLVKIEG